LLVGWNPDERSTGWNEAVDRIQVPAAWKLYGRVDDPPDQCHRDCRSSLFIFSRLLLDVDDDAGCVHGVWGKLVL
jgi:hypothetical protein